MLAPLVFPVLLALICILNWNQEVVKAVKTVWSSVNNDRGFGCILGLSILALKPHLLLMLWLGPPSAKASLRAQFLLCLHCLKRVDTQMFKSGVHFLCRIFSWGRARAMARSPWGVSVSCIHTSSNFTISCSICWLLLITRKIHPRDTRKGFQSRLEGFKATFFGRTTEGRCEDRLSCG